MGLMVNADTARLIAQCVIGRLAELQPEGELTQPSGLCSWTSVAARMS
jgi:hypothetical protein